MVTKKHRFRATELLLDSDFFQDLVLPEIFNDGLLGNYFAGVEKILADQKEWVHYGQDSVLMREHTARVMARHQNYGELIEILESEIKPYLNSDRFLISGGQRRDWIVSLMVARRLGLPHLSLYKETGPQSDRLDLIEPNGVVLGRDSIAERIRGYRAIHVLDIIRAGSSIYRVENDRKLGWVPQLENLGLTISDAFAVVSRREGGEQNLLKQGLVVHSLVDVDQDFLQKHSQHPDRALAYYRDPLGWCQKYLLEQGAESLFLCFNPEVRKLDHAKRLLQRFGPFIRESDVKNNTNHYGALRSAVQSRYQLEGKPFDIAQLEGFDYLPRRANGSYNSNRH